MDRLFRRCCVTSAAGGVLTPHGGTEIDSVESFRQALLMAQSYLEVLHAVRSVTEARMIQLAAVDWQNALKKTGPHAHAVLREVEGNALNGAMLDEACYHIVVISLVTLAMKQVHTESKGRLLSDALDVILTMEQRGLNQDVVTAYQAVAHAATVGKHDALASRAQACIHRATRLKKVTPKDSPPGTPIAKTTKPGPPAKLKLDGGNFEDVVARLDPEEV